MSSWGVNPKAIQKRQRDKQKKQQENRTRQDRKQREKWKDQETQKALQKKRNKQSEQIEDLKRRQQKRKLVEEQERQMAKYSKKGTTEVKKLTMAQIAARQIKAMQQNAIESDDEQFEENPNKEIGTEIKADNVQDALEQLDLDDRPDKHPEKRMKAAWNEYLELNLPRVKAENPSLKRSQHIEMLQHEWKKSPMNPYNQKMANYNEKV